MNEIGEAISDIDPYGQVKVHGEIWAAASIEGKISKGSKIIIIEVSNLQLKIKKV